MPLLNCNEKSKINSQVDLMKIVAIFTGKLYAVKYKGESKHELKRLLSDWNDTNYLYNFLKLNQKDIPKGKDIEQMMEIISDNSTVIDETLQKIAKSAHQRLEEFFQPLNNQEYIFRDLSHQKGRENYLRLYAIKIDDNCFLITGGAIKLTRWMDERIHTQKELEKLNYCRDFLVAQNVFDECSFHDFITDIQ